MLQLHSFNFFFDKLMIQNQKMSYSLCSSRLLEIYENISDWSLPKYRNISKLDGNLDQKNINKMKKCYIYMIFIILYFSYI